MEFMLLGPLQVDVGGSLLSIPAPKIEKLLALLLIRANRSVQTEEIIAELWDEKPPRRARAALHVYVSQIRRFLADNGAESSAVTLTTRNTGYQLQVNPESLDVTAAIQHHARGQALLDEDPAAALGEFMKAAAVFRGPVLGGAVDGRIVGGYALWAEELRLECLESIAHSSLRIGRNRELVGELAQWIEEFPLHETFREQLMIALHRSGRRAEALAQFQATRRLLLDELGLEPRESMRQAQAMILNTGSSWPIRGPLGSTA